MYFHVHPRTSAYFRVFPRIGIFTFLIKCKGNEINNLYKKINFKKIDDNDNDNDDNNNDKKTK